ncbi:hypothetical protein OHQ89_46945 [Streptomyces canus]|uniref:hypothetical protein n=1 Tax=Streptomyces canus TaxID=58343 RepID=UPI0030E00F49
MIVSYQHVPTRMFLYLLPVSVRAFLLPEKKPADGSDDETGSAAPHTQAEEARLVDIEVTALTRH